LCCGYRGGLVFEAHRLFVSLNLRLKDLLGPVTRVKKKKKQEQTDAVSPQKCEMERRSRKVDIRLPGKGNSNSRGARPVYYNHFDD